MAKKTFAVAAVIVSFLVFPCIAGGDALPEPHSTDLLVSGGPVFIVWPETDSFMTCQISIVAPTTRIQRRKPVITVALLDISKSMEGEPLGAAKNAVKALAESIKDGDMFGVVAFSTYVRDVFPVQVMNAGSRTAAQNAISSLGDEERRNTAGGIKRAFEMFDKFKGQDAAGRYLMIITNGNPDNGNTDRGAILSEASGLAKQYSVNISTFGFRYFDRSGSDFDEDFLYALSDATGGRYHFIDDPQKIAPMVLRESDRTGSASARDVVIEITPPGKRSKIVNVTGGQTNSDGNISIGDMASSGVNIVIFDIEGRPVRETDCQVKVKYSDGQTQQEVLAYIDIPLASGEGRLSPQNAPRIIAWDLQAGLAETSQNIALNRNEYVMVFRDKVKDLEQENVILDSDYLRKTLAYYTQFERTISNSAVEPAVVCKLIKYRASQMLWGE